MKPLIIVFVKIVCLSGIIQHHQHELAKCLQDEVDKTQQEMHDLMDTLNLPPIEADSNKFTKYKQLIIRLSQKLDSIIGITDQTPEGNKCTPEHAKQVETLG